MGEIDMYTTINVLLNQSGIGSQWQTKLTSAVETKNVY